MKFYFDGDSFTYGGGLTSKCGIDPTQVRWSKLISDHFGAEEINVSMRGGSNDKILRQLFVENIDIVKECDFIFIQLTYPFRNEFWSKKYHKWVRYNLITDFKKSGEMNKFEKHFGSKFNDWIAYYEDKIYTHKYGKTRELVAYNAIVSHLKLLGKPFFMLGLSHYRYNTTQWSRHEPPIDYDLHFADETFERIPNDDHPSVVGHRQISEKIINKIKHNEVLL